ncbi:phosphoribosyltransferase [Acidocella sp. C78]|uniref:phosphoribosyltransferase n=1 Tax=Acidocella sp. C78 TaxID=1671486 RepID=UPI00191B9152|nr:phosphoribosyltransferase family protein [Acidocella sp. C78]
MFQDRHEAGLRLAARLRRFRRARPVVLALPRGGVPVGFEVAAALEAPLDVLLVHKLGAPHQPELAIGALGEGETAAPYIDTALVRRLGAPAAYIAGEQTRQAAELARRRSVYCAGRAAVAIGGRTAIVVDDGIASGATMRVALEMARARHPKRLVLAVPVAGQDVIARLRPLADEVVCVEMPASLGAVGEWYADFGQVGDDEVVDTLARAAARPGANRG